MSIDTANNEEMMAGSNITKFYTSEQEEPITTELLNKASNVPELTSIHDAMIEDTTTEAIHDPLNPLIINSILVRMIHFPPIQ